MQDLIAHLRTGLRLHTRNVIVRHRIDGRRNRPRPLRHVHLLLHLTPDGPPGAGGHPETKTVESLGTICLLITYHQDGQPPKYFQKDSMPDVRAVAKALGLKLLSKQRMLKA